MDERVKGREKVRGRNRTEKRCEKGGGWWGVVVAIGVLGWLRGGRLRLREDVEIRDREKEGRWVGGWMQVQSSWTYEVPSPDKENGQEGRYVHHRISEEGTCPEEGRMGRSGEEQECNGRTNERGGVGQKEKGRWTGQG